MEDNKLLEIFTTWQFGVTAVVIAALVDRIKRVCRDLLPKWKDGRVLKAVFSSLNIVLGVGAGAIPAWLPGERFAHRAMVGICAGFLSNFVYTTILKHLGGKKITGTPSGETPIAPVTPIQSGGSHGPEGTDK